MAREEKGPEKLKFHVFRDERFIDLNLYQFGWERTSPTHSYGPYARNHYLFHYVFSGTGYLRSNNSAGETKLSICSTMSSRGGGSCSPTIRPTA